MPSTLSDDKYKLLYYFVGDEAFPLAQYLLPPENIKIIFSNRLSRGRKSVECAIGIMTQKVLSSAIRSRAILRVMDIIKSVCILHNFARTINDVAYTPQVLKLLITSLLYYGKILLYIHGLLLII